MPSISLQYPRLGRLCLLHGRHREGVQREVQRAEDQRLLLDSRTRRASPQTEVRTKSQFAFRPAYLNPVSFVFVTKTSSDVSASFLNVQARYVCRRRLGFRIQIVCSVPGRHADLHQVVSSDGRSCSLRQRPALLHQDVQQVTAMVQCSDWSNRIELHFRERSQPELRLPCRLTFPMQVEADV